MKSTAQQKHLHLGETSDPMRFPYLWISLLVAATVNGAPLEKLPLIQKSRQPTQAKFPAIVYNEKLKAAKVVQIQLDWLPSPNGMQTASWVPLERKEATPSQLWYCAWVCALELNEPWGGAQWNIIAPPTIEEEGTRGALAIGILSALANSPFPANTAVVAGLHPNGMLAPLRFIRPRLEAASSAGIKRVVLSKLQNVIVDTADSSPLMDFAGQLGLEIVFASDLREVAGLLLEKNLPHPAQPIAKADYNEAWFNLFDQRYFEEHKSLEYSLALLPPTIAGNIRDDFDEVLMLQESAVRSHHEGRIFAAEEQMLRARARYEALSRNQGKSTRDGSNSAETTSQAEELISLIESHRTRKDSYTDELERDLIFSEKSAWLRRIEEPLELRYLRMRQASAPGSRATALDRLQAERRLREATTEARYQLKDLRLYEELENLSRGNYLSISQSQLRSTLGYLIPAGLAIFGPIEKELRERVTDHPGELFEQEVVSQSRTLNELQLMWQGQLSDTALESEVPGEVRSFNPGTAYLPTSKRKLTSSSLLNDSVRCFFLINICCELSLIAENRIWPGGKLGESSDGEQALKTLLDAANRSARSSMAQALKGGVDLSILACIHERARDLSLKSSRSSKLEALREFWRCDLLGKTYSQLVQKASRPSQEDRTGASTPSSVKALLTPDSELAAMLPEDSALPAPQLQTEPHPTPISPPPTREPPQITEPPPSTLPHVPAPTIEPHPPEMPAPVTPQEQPPPSVPPGSIPALPVAEDEMEIELRQGL